MSHVSLKSIIKPSKAEIALAFHTLDPTGDPTLRASLARGPQLLLVEGLPAHPLRLRLKRLQFAFDLTTLICPHLSLIQPQATSKDD